MGAHDISPSGPIPSWLLTFLAQQKPLPPPAHASRPAPAEPAAPHGWQVRVTRPLTASAVEAARRPRASPAARPAFQTTQWRVTLEQVLQLDDISRL